MPSGFGSLSQPKRWSTATAALAKSLESGEAMRHPLESGGRTPTPPRRRGAPPVGPIKPSRARAVNDRPRQALAERRPGLVAGHVDQLVAALAGRRRQDHLQLGRLVELVEGA